MNKKGKFYSLNVQLTMAVILGILLASVMYVVVSTAGQRLISEMFLSEEAIERNIGEVYEDLEEYISEHDVQAADTEKLESWLREHKNTYLSIYDNYGSRFEAGWQYGSIYNRNDSIIDYADKIIPDTDRIDEETFFADTKNRIIEFADDEYYVYIDQYKEMIWYNVLQITTIIICFITLCTTILVYNATVLKRLRTFTEQVSSIAEGNLEGEISTTHNDEIGMLAENVDYMRQSIIEKHENEKKAWAANQDLITAMSHDIRSPLTSIIGYLDIIKDKSDGIDEESEKYIDSCRDKAFQLKTLSDKMFQYFLVFGNPDENMELEKVDAGILFQQIIGEHNAELYEKGYITDVRSQVEEGFVKVDISSVRRVFDNVFSNILKYADMKKPVVTDITCDEKIIRIDIENMIPEIAKKVESNRIGIRTCQKLCGNMGGTFSCEEDAGRFRVHVEFPLEP